MPLWKRKSCTTETKRKISLATRGKITSDKIRLKISFANKKKRKKVKN